MTSIGCVLFLCPLKDLLRYISASIMSIYVNSYWSFFDPIQWALSSRYSLQWCFVSYWELGTNCDAEEEEYRQCRSTIRKNETKRDCVLMRTCFTQPIHTGLRCFQRSRSFSYVISSARMTLRFLPAIRYRNRIVDGNRNNDFEYLRNIARVTLGKL